PGAHFQRLNPKCFLTVAGSNGLLADGSATRWTGAPEHHGVLPGSAAEARCRAEPRVRVQEPRTAWAAARAPVAHSGAGYRLNDCRSSDRPVVPLRAVAEILRFSQRVEYWTPAAVAPPVHAPAAIAVSRPAGATAEPQVRPNAVNPFRVQAPSRFAAAEPPSAVAAGMRPLVRSAAATAPVDVEQADSSFAGSGHLGQERKIASLGPPFAAFRARHRWAERDAAQLRASRDSPVAVPQLAEDGERNGPVRQRAGGWNSVLAAIPVAARQRVCSHYWLCSLQA